MSRVERGRGWTMYLGDCLEIMPTFTAVDHVITDKDNQRVLLGRAQAARFWSKVERGAECWLWRAAVDKDGYGKFQLTTRSRPKQIHVRAHRLAWALANGKMPPSGLVVMHACDNPRCVNPAHLSLGTQSENRADCTHKGRNATGDRNGACLHPESRPRGGDHWTHRKPHLVKRGVAWRAARGSA